MSNRKQKSIKTEQSCAPVQDTNCDPQILNADLEEIIRYYRTKTKPRVDATLKYFTELPSIEIAIEKASMALTPEGKRHPHQHRLKKTVLEQVKANLLNNKQFLIEAKSFDDIWKTVNDCRVYGFGELSIYDCALHIAANLKKYPDVVYLHAGTLVGAIKLGLATPKNQNNFS